MVADAVEAHHVRQLRRRLLGRGAEPLGEILLARAVVVRRPRGQHSRAIGSLPPEGLALERLLVGTRPEEEVGVHPRLGQDLWDDVAVPKRVRVVAHRRDLVETARQVALAVERLAHERLTRGDVAVGLHPPAAGQIPSALRDPLADPREQLGVLLLHPAEVDRLAAGEDELRRLFHAVEGRLEGLPDHTNGLVPAPQPCGVDVCVADAVHGDITEGACRLLGHGRCLRCSVVVRER